MRELLPQHLKLEIDTLPHEEAGRVAMRPWRGGRQRAHTPASLTAKSYCIVTIGSL
jgi:hypothetical protein